MKQELLKYFADENLYKKYEAGEFTNATRFTYTAVISALDDDADTLVIKVNYFEWTKDGDLLGRFLGPKAFMPVPPYPEVFKIMLKRDATLRKYTNIATEDSEEMHVTIVHVD